MDPVLLDLAASLAVGLLIGLERERNPLGKAGVRTFALIALLGALAVLVAEHGATAWPVPVGLAAVAAMLVVAHARIVPPEDPGTTTVAAGCVAYLLGALAGFGQPALAGSLAIGVTALLYFKPELESATAALSLEEQVSVLQFLVASFIVLPILPDRGFGPYAVLNPRTIWLMVVLITGIGLASHVALRLAGERHGALLTGLLGGLVSSTATTVLYARRSGEALALRRLAGVVVPIANLVPLARIAFVTAVVAPSLLGALAPVLACALAGGAAATAFAFPATRAAGEAPVPPSRNPAQLGAALRFAALFAVVLFVSAWLTDVGGSGGLFVTALASGMVDVDPVVLSALNLYGTAELPARHAVTAIAIAYASNVAFKLGVTAWYDRALALHVAGPLAATVAGGIAGLLLASGVS